MEKLLDASKLLRTSIDEYIKACSVVTASYDPTNEQCNSYSPLDCISNELQTIDAYEKDIRDAKAMLARSRNSSPTLVPISALPSDVLEWVLEQVYHSWLRTEDIERVKTDTDEYEGVHSDYIQYDMDIKLPSLN